MSTSRTSSGAALLRGEPGVLADPMRREMERAAQNQEFERAANLRDRLDDVESFHGGAGGAVASQDDTETTDVLGVAVEGDRATVARLHAERGQLVERDQHYLDAPDSENRIADLLAAFLVQFYAERDLPDRLLLPEAHGDDDVAAWLDAAGVEVQVPGAGREATLVDLALKNAHRRGGDGDELGALADALGIDRPERIEGFDVSHAQGKATVGSDVCFVGGSAAKADYRRKKLDDENDDYANMKRLVRWRAERAIEGRDDRPDPDLLLIDGGEGQLNAAREALDEAGWGVPAVALAKDEEIVITPTGRTTGTATRHSSTSSSACATRPTGSPSRTTRPSATRCRPRWTAWTASAPSCESASCGASGASRRSARRPRPTCVTSTASARRPPRPSRGGSERAGTTPWYYWPGCGSITHNELRRRAPQAAR